jgi:hypothetical protein
VERNEIRTKETKTKGSTKYEWEQNKDMKPRERTRERESRVVPIYGMKAMEE